MNNGLFGKTAEDFVVNYLQQNQFRIVARNYKKFFGEIDIIAQKDDVITFVEVKARKNSKVSMFELVSYDKQKKIIQTAHSFIAENYNSKIYYRFDVALVYIDSCELLKVMYVPNAFV
ncbi:YraN family protein [Candidatus Dependentiae bacterium]|nr:YraN family protein [Candidatus Dependentiae bacterium]